MYIACATSNKIVKATLGGKLLSAIGIERDHITYNLTGPWDYAKTQLVMFMLLTTRMSGFIKYLVLTAVSYIKPLKCKDHAFGVAIDFHGNVHIATASGMETFDSRVEYNDGAQCGHVANNEENYRFVTHSVSNGKLEVHKPDNSLLHSIHGLHCPYGVYLDQSGAFFIAEWDTKKALKY